MKKGRIWLLAVVLVAALTAVVACGGKYLSHTYRTEKTLERSTLVLDDQTVTISETQQKNYLGDRTILRRQYQLGNGDTVTQARVQNGNWSSRWEAVETWDLPSKEGAIWYYDPAVGAWQQAALAPAVLSATAAYLVTSDVQYFVFIPWGYRQVEHACLQETGSRGYLTITQTEGGWRVQVFGSYLNAGEVCDYTVVRSDDPAPLWDTAENSLALWATYAQPRDWKWCYDGYYRPCPETYEPHGSGVYFRSVISYLTKSLEALAGSNRCADDLTVAMLDTVSRLAEDDGSMHTKTRSAWLWEDYGIGADYYDTRWNSDAMLLYLTFAQRHGGFRDVMEDYLAFYLDYAEKYHHTTENGGWFVYDYCNPDADVPVHTSLNHQLAEMQVLYDYSDYLQRPDLAALADRMLLAIEDTWPQWIKPDGDLQYCYYGEGVYGRADYPYLTYNDLFTMQKTLLTRNGEENTALRALMESKLRWMTQQGITGYFK